MIPQRNRKPTMTREMLEKYSSPQEIHNTYGQSQNFQTELRYKIQRIDASREISFGPALFAPPVGKSPPFHLHGATFLFTLSGLEARRDPSVRTENGCFFGQAGQRHRAAGHVSATSARCTRVPEGRRAQGKGHVVFRENRVISAMFIAHQPLTAPELAFQHRKHDRRG